MHVVGHQKQGLEQALDISGACLAAFTVSSVEGDCWFIHSHAHPLTGMGTTVQKTKATPNSMAMITEVIQRTPQFSGDFWGSRKSPRDIEQTVEVLEQVAEVGNGSPLTLAINVGGLKHSKGMFDKLVKMHEATYIGVSTFYIFMTMLNQKWDRSPSTLSSNISSISTANAKLVTMKIPIDPEFLAFILLSFLPKDNVWEAFCATVLNSLAPGTSLAFPALADHLTFTATAQQGTSVRGCHIPPLSCSPSL
ncbi:hypothetical protein E4T56_gene3470 [Termitomyces sp. T112]|nr:hypothetical protein E4T56_gene3470 [Termitomyces sp. T112]